ncbi:hypothetical protein ACVWZK_004872 [Bradyrhizobium sp. GM0.4]
MSDSADSATLRGGHLQAGGARGIMSYRLGEQVVEPAAIGALGGGFVDLEQHFGLSAADRLVVDGRGGEDAGAPGGVIGIERAGEVHPSLGGRAFARDHAVAHDGQCMGRGIAAGWFEGR